MAFLLGIGGYVMIFKSKKLFPLAIWIVLPAWYELLFAKLFTSRHALLLVLPIIICTAYAIKELLERKKILAISLLSISLGVCMFYDYVLYTNPLDLPSFYPSVASTDLKPYIHGF